MQNCSNIVILIDFDDIVIVLIVFMIETTVIEVVIIVWRVYSLNWDCSVIVTERKQVPEAQIESESQSILSQKHCYFENCGWIFDEQLSWIAIILS